MPALFYNTEEELVFGLCSWLKNETENFYQQQWIAMLLVGSMLKPSC